jgi:hypothetical protein
MFDSKGASSFFVPELIHDLINQCLKCLVPVNIILMPSWSHF